VNLSEWIDLKALGTTAVAFLPRLLAAALILFLFWVAFRSSRAALHKIMLRAHFEEALIDLLIDNIYRSALMRDRGGGRGREGGHQHPAGARGTRRGGCRAGVRGAGLGRQHDLGVSHLWDKPFRVGDYVSVQEQYGRVTRSRCAPPGCGPRQQLRGHPNRKIIESTLVNHSKHGGMRIDVPVTISGSESVDEARRALLGAMAGIEGVVDEPEPDVVVKALGVAGTDLLLRVWIDDAALERPVFYRVTEAAKEALARAGLETPSPQIQLVMEQSEALLKPAPEKRRPPKTDDEDE
jgi:small conductance mechanosensitive channel